MKESGSAVQFQGGFSKPIGSYRYALFAKDNHIGPIFLFDAGGKLIGRVSFLARTPSQGALPLSTIGQDEVVSLYYWTTAFADLICMLRNESYKALIRTGDDNSRVSTGS
ncbi:hypothetical protein [Cyanobium sp. N5-Cardenillas]|uniref:hypothetical protein n=1 Tax=Cyanobium sp. N5-Cardenillas TaxID=2823720 RepID=UPI0020CE145B|nr:hypothetical protein [Cyanobium sp. N5-Cardenillas]